MLNKIRNKLADVQKGTYNLAILMLGIIFLSSVTTGVSLYLYKISGDIYLDRSRPGFLPDKEETNEEIQNEVNYSYSDTGTIDADELSEYRQELQKIIDRLNSASAYPDNPLSDESLGIVRASEENDEPHD